MGVREDLAAIRARRAKALSPVTTAPTRSVRDDLKAVRAKLRTKTLDDMGVTAAEIKRRAAAGEPLVQEGLHRPSAAEGLGASTAGVVGGMAKNLAQILTIPADIVAAPIAGAGTGIGTMLGGGSYDEAVEASKNVMLQMPRTQLAEEAGNDLRETTKRVLGVKPGAITDVSDVSNDLLGQVVGPGLGITEARLAMAGSPLTKAANEAAEAALRREAATRTTREIPESGVGVVRDGAEITPEVAEMVRQAGDAQDAARNRAAGVRAPEQTEPDFVANELERRRGATGGQTLYHFTDDIDRLTATGPRGSSTLGQGVGPADGDLVGTFLGDSPETLNQVYGPNFKRIEQRAAEGGTRAGYVRMELDPSAKVLDSVADQNASYMALRARFESSAPDHAPFGTPEYKQQFTDFVRGEGYDAVRFWNTYVSGGHPETVVINESKLRVLPENEGPFGAPVKRGNYVETSGTEVTARPQEPPAPFDTEAYLRERVAAREAARSKGELSGRAKVRQEFASAKAAVVDYLAPIEDAIGAAVRAQGRVLRPSEEITNALDSAIMADHVAGQFARDHGIEQVLRDAPDVDALGEYLLARHAPAFEAAGHRSGRDLAKDAQYLAAHRAVYEPLANVVDEYARALMNYRVEAGLVSREYADYVTATYPEYVPFKRVFSEAERSAAKQGTGGGAASLGKQTTDLKATGSLRETEDPIESLLAKTHEAFRQGEKNKAARLLTTYRYLEGNPLGLEPLRTAENVNKRLEVIGELSTLGKEQRRFHRELLSTSRKLGDAEVLLKRQFERVNRAIATTANESQAIYDAMRVAAADFDPASAVDDLLAQSVATEKKIQAAIERVNVAQERRTVSLESQGLAAERRLYELQGRREQIDYGSAAERKTELQQALNGLKTAINERKAIVTQLRSELRAAADKPKAPADHTINFLNNGVRETWKVNPEIAKAAKGMDVERLNLLGRALAIPTRILKLGATGLNPVFIARNLVRDQALAAVLSDATTSVAHPINFLASLNAAVGHGDPYRQAVRDGALFTSFDIARDAPRLAVDQIIGTRRAFRRAMTQADRTGASKVTTSLKYAVTTPAQLLRAAEDLVSRSEQLTRIQVYSGTYTKLVSEGMSRAEARIAAKRAALWTTGPFHRSGQWGRVLNGAIPYLNANIQGWRVLLRGIKERPNEVGAKVAALVYLPVMGAIAWNVADPDRRKAWDNIEEREKIDNLIIVPSNPTKDARGRWNVIKIPLPQGVNDLIAPLRRFGEWAGRQALTGNQRAIDVVAMLLGPEDSGNKVLSMASLQAVRPSLEVHYNKNFYTGRNLVPQYLENAPPERQVYPWTSGTARIIGKSIDASPIKVEHFIRASAGGGGTQALNATDAMLAWMGIIPKNQVGGESVPAGLERAFTKAQGSRQRASRVQYSPPGVTGVYDPDSPEMVKPPRAANEFSGGGIRSENADLIETLHPALILPKRFRFARAQDIAMPVRKGALDFTGSAEGVHWGGAQGIAFTPFGGDDQNNIAISREANDYAADLMHEEMHAAIDGGDVTTAELERFREFYDSKTAQARELELLDTALAVKNGALVTSHTPEGFRQYLDLDPEELEVRANELASQFYGNPSIPSAAKYYKTDYRHAMVELAGQFVANPKQFKARYPDWYAQFVPIFGREYTELTVAEKARMRQRKRVELTPFEKEPVWQSPLRRSRSGIVEERRRRSVVP